MVISTFNELIQFYIVYQPRHEEVNQPTLLWKIQLQAPNTIVVMVDSDWSITASNGLLFLYKRPLLSVTERC